MGQMVKRVIPSALAAIPGYVDVEFIEEEGEYFGALAEVVGGAWGFYGYAINLDPAPYGGLLIYLPGVRTSYLNLSKTAANEGSNTPKKETK